MVKDYRGLLGPPQTRHLVVDNYLLSTTNILSDAIIPHIGVLIVNNCQASESLGRLPFTTHAHNTVRDQAVTVVVDS